MPSFAKQDEIGAFAQALTAFCRENVDATRIELAPDGADVSLRNRTDKLLIGLQEAACLQFEGQGGTEDFARDGQPLVVRSRGVV